MGAYLSTVATDALELKPHAINIHSADKIFITLKQFYTEISCFSGIKLKKIIFWKKKYTQLFTG